MNGIARVEVNDISVIFTVPNWNGNLLDEKVVRIIIETAWKRPVGKIKIIGCVPADDFPYYL